MSTTELNEIIAKADKYINSGKIFEVIQGDIYFYIGMVPCKSEEENDKSASLATIKDGNSEVNEKVAYYFSNRYNSRFTNMKMNLKVEPVSIESFKFVSVDQLKNGSGCELLINLIKHYYNNPSFVYCGRNSPQHSKQVEQPSSQLIFISLYSLPKEWATNTDNGLSHSHSHVHTYTHTHDGLEEHTHTHSHSHTHDEQDVASANYADYH